MLFTYLFAFSLDFVQFVVLFNDIYEFLSELAVVKHTAIAAFVVLNFKSAAGLEGN